MKKIKELREKRGKLVAELRSLVDGAKYDEKGNFNSEDQAKFEQLNEQVDSLKNRIDKEERALSLETEISEIPEEERAIDFSKEHKEIRDGEVGEDVLFRQFLKNGAAGVQNSEYRDLSSNVFTSGGSFIPPVKWVQKLIKKLDSDVFIRQLATVSSLTGSQTLGVPTLEEDPSDPEWTSEVPSSDPSADTGMKTGGREFKPSALQKLAKISKNLLQNSTIPVDDLVLERLAYKFAVAEENAFLNGSGANQPLGVFTASDHGISTSRDVSTDNTSTSITYDGLIEVKSKLKSGYHRNSNWVFHGDGQKQLLKLKDSDGQYIWRESVRLGEPDMLFGIPIRISDFCPNVFTTGKYVGILGDFSNYWICDGQKMQIQRLLEMYALRRKVGIVADRETDGMPVLEEAFVRIQLA